MNERQLKSFLQAADMNSFSKAAEAGFISPSALIQQINLLEKELGFSLFERSYHGNRLTPSGEVFYKAAKDILRLYEQALQEGRRLSICDDPTLTVSCPYEQFPGFLMQAYRNCIARFPMLKVHFLHASFEAQFEEILQGRADLSFTAEPAPSHMKGLVFTPLAEDTCSFCMNPAHPLANIPFLTPELLRPYRVLCGRYEYMRTPFSVRLEQYGISSKQIDKEYNMEVRLRTMASNDLFVIHSLWSRPYQDTLKVISSDIPAGKMGFLSKDRLSSAAVSFVDLCKETISAIIS